jgi:hypothetical protein
VYGRIHTCFVCVSVSRCCAASVTGLVDLLSSSPPARARLTHSGSRVSIFNDFRTHVEYTYRLCPSAHPPRIDPPLVAMSDPKSDAKPSAAAAAAPSSSSAAPTTGAAAPAKQFTGYHSFMVNACKFTVDAKYQPLKPLGRGAYGVVWSAAWRYDKHATTRMNSHATQVRTVQYVTLVLMSSLCSCLAM